MPSREVLVVGTGTSNLASVLAGLNRVGASPRVTTEPAEVVAAEHLVLPGVGALAAAMERLRKFGLVDPLRNRIEAGRPTLAVCLGLQLLCRTSEESPDVGGLGVVPGHVTRFPEGLRVPQIGWNDITVSSGCRILRDGHVYFANSFRLEHTPEGWAPALADYGGRFVAAMERGAVIACQFHPELSGELGLDLIRRWLDLENYGGASC